MSFYSHLKNIVQKVILIISTIIASASALTAIIEVPGETSEIVLAVRKVLDVMALNVGHNDRNKTE